MTEFIHRRLNGEIRFRNGGAMFQKLWDGEVEGVLGGKCICARTRIILSLLEAYLSSVVTVHGVIWQTVS